MTDDGRPSDASDRPGATSGPAQPARERAPEPARPPGRTSVGLVLGAGGVAGAAFHAGVLAALADATGWDPRRADLVVGTSAGASTAASLRGGLGPTDLLARATGRPLSPAGTELVAGYDRPLTLDELDETPRGSWWDELTRFVPAAPWLVGPALLRAGPTRWGVALAGLVPAGRVPTDLIGRPIRAAAADRWPDEPTWIASYRTGDARRVVFGRDDVEVPDLATAVEASSAVPGRFRPVTLESGRYVDGAVYSPTNADVVAPLAFDLVVVSAPMSADPTTRAELSGWPGRARGWFAGLLDREMAAVAQGGAATLVIEPRAGDLLAMRSDLPDRELGPLVADTAYESVRTQLDEGCGPGLDMLARARP